MLIPMVPGVNCASTEDNRDEAEIHRKVLEPDSAEQYVVVDLLQEVLEAVQIFELEKQHDGRHVEVGDDQEKGDGGDWG